MLSWFGPAPFADVMPSMKNSASTDVFEMSLEAEGGKLPIVLTTNYSTFTVGFGVKNCAYRSIPYERNESIPGLEILTHRIYVRPRGCKLTSFIIFAEGCAM